MVEKCCFNLSFSLNFRDNHNDYEVSQRINVSNYYYDGNCISHNDRIKFLVHHLKKLFSVSFFEAISLKGRERIFSKDV